MLPATVEAELADLRRSGLRAVLFGGWAKEFLGGWEGEHKDLDLLVVADSMAPIDAFLAQGEREIIEEKRHRHKRGYFKAGLLVELFLVETDADGLNSNCYGRYRHRWLRPLGRALGNHAVEVVTPENILAYERAHPKIEEAFYQKFPEIRREIELAYGDTRFPYPELFKWPLSKGPSDPGR